MNHGGEAEARARAEVRRFLLGQLAEHEREHVEKTLMVDSDYREHVLLVEEALIEDYVDGVLPADDQKAFETYFLASTQQRRRVKLATLLQTFGSENLLESGRPKRPPPAQRRRWPINVVIRNHPVVFTSIVVAFVLIIGFGVLQGVRLWRESSQRIEAAKRKLEIERELTQLSTAPAQELSASTFPLTLVPLVLRNATDASTLSIPSPAEIIELRLILSGDVYSNYTVELNRTGGEETYRIEGLHAQTAPTGQAVLVRIPSRLLSAGDYKLSLSGVANGKRTGAGEYIFQVRSQ